MHLKKLFSTLAPVRWCVQWAFLLWCIFLGVQFYLFVRHFESGGLAPAYLRPPGVEGFLPIGALVSLKHWLANGQIDPVHPAALVLFLTFALLSFLARKAFCSWLCPVGTLSEALWRMGRRLFGRNFRVWSWLDWPLRLVKYGLFAYFAKFIFIDMPAVAVRGFLAAPYWAISDVKMLHFFTRLSATALGVVLVLALLSMLIQNFWCRYLCPYGAWLSLFSTLSPARIVRRQESCSDCGACSRACPSRIAVAQKKAVYSPECTGCQSCTDSCPRPGALYMGLGPLAIRKRFYLLLILGVFALGVGWGMVTGHWESSLSYADYQRLIPLAERLGH